MSVTPLNESQNLHSQGMLVFKLIGLEWTEGK